MHSLPFELEREIFELTARVYPQCAARLARVARRTRAWIEPLIYETLEAYPQHSLRLRGLITAIQAKPGEFFAEHVKTLCIHTPLAVEIGQILSVCTRITTLRMGNWSHKIYEHEEALDGDMSLRPWVATELWDHLTQNYADQPLFRTITRLEMELDDPMINPGRFMRHPMWADPQLFPQLRELVVFLELPFKRCIMEIQQFMNELPCIEICVMLMPIRPADAEENNGFRIDKPKTMKSFLIKTAAESHLEHLLPRTVIMPWRRQDVHGLDVTVRRLLGCARMIAKEQGEGFERGEECLLTAHFFTGVYINNDRPVDVSHIEFF